ncbi:MAG: HEAT repeat domain-containing protein [Planctomycetota bacterium]
MPRLSRFWFLFVPILGVILVNGCTAPPAPVGGESTRELLAAGRLDPATQDALRRLIDPNLAFGDRRAAAYTLLNHDPVQSTPALAAAIADPGAPGASDAVVQALLLRPDAPDPALVDPLTQALFASSSDTREALAEVLGRFDDPQLVNRLRDRAADPAATHNTRLGTIEALGYQRTRESARALLALTEPPTPDDLRYASFDALAELSGLEDLGPDPVAWQAWWDQARRLSNERWQATLVENLARRDASRRLRQSQTEQRLLESQRTLYRTTSPDDRPAVLAYMLNEPLTPIRRLGMDLVLERLLEGLPFDEPLRQAMRARLTDTDAQVRGLAALRLADLNDDLAADRVADRLAARSEHVNEVLDAYLKLIARLPRRQAAPPALALLDRPPTHAAAAAALAAMAKADMLTDAQRAQAARSVRATLSSTDPPPPPVITLLGRVGTDGDWRWITVWIDARDAAVKRAAAEAWAESDRSLRPLADRMTDTVIQPIVIAAATARGTDPATLRALADHPPQRTQVFDAWRRAMIAMAGRVPPRDALDTVADLRARGDLPAELYEQMLTATLQRPDAAGLDAATLADVRLLRAQVRLERNQPAAAREDFAALGPGVNDLSPAQRDRYYRGAIDANLRADRPDAAFALARDMLGPASAPTPLAATDDPVVDRFIEYARRQAARQNNLAARDTLLSLRELLGPRIKPEVANRVALLLAELNQRTPPPATAGDAVTPGP